MKTKLFRVWIVTIILMLTYSSITAQNLMSYTFYERYDQYREASVDSKRVDYNVLAQFIKDIAADENFKVKTAGYSLEGREIFLISIGSGPINVLAWSQMHGDESTATMALLDIFNFFRQKDDLDQFKTELLQKVTLNFIPMLNPDGAEKFTRRNALQIDLNRDALRLQFPESQVLKSVRDSLNPQFGFNLHDQNTRYTAGISKKSASISFLAPAFNYEKEINDVRANTMKLIASINNELQNFIPGHVGRYNDDFEPRAFGDNFVKWGTSSVLIESGGWKNDIEKQFLRKMNFVAILTGFHSIAASAYEKFSLEDYTGIPENERMLFDLLLRNVNIKYNNKFYKIDIGIDLQERSIKGNEGYYFKSSIEDIGDLSTFYGYKDIDCGGLVLENGKVFESESAEEMDERFLLNLVKEGFTIIKTKAKFDQNFSKMPIDIISNNKEGIEFKLGNSANFVLMRDDKIIYSIVNGFLYDHLSEKNLILNGLIID